MPGNNELVPTGDIESKILLIRGYKVMLDRDLAKLYGISTGALNQAVKRNIKRFPDDFMFQLSNKETKEVITICDNLFSLKYSPVNHYVFTEQGVAMLSSVLNTERAVMVNIQIMRTFTRLRKIMLTHQDIQIKIEKLLRQQISQAGHLAEHDKDISAIFEAIKQLIQSNAAINKQLTYEEEKQSNKKWGFQPPDK